MRETIFNVMHILRRKILYFTIYLPHGEMILLTLQVPGTKIAKFANSVDLGEVTHNEPPHLDLHCLPPSL